MKLKINRQFFFCLGAILLLIGIAVFMVIIGRGHTLYFDNKTVELGSTTVKSLYRVKVNVKGNDTQEAYARERVQAKTMGQNLKLELLVTEAKNGEEKLVSYSIKLPYDMDGVVISLPLLLAGYDQSEWMSQFVSLATTSEVVEEVVTDEFGLSEL